MKAVAAAAAATDLHFFSINSTVSPHLYLPINKTPQSCHVQELVPSVIPTLIHLSHNPLQLQRRHCSSSDFYRFVTSATSFSSSRTHSSSCSRGFLCESRSRWMRRRMISFTVFRAAVPRVTHVRSTPTNGIATFAIIAHTIPYPGIIYTPACMLSQRRAAARATRLCARPPQTSRWGGGVWGAMQPQHSLLLQLNLMPPVAVTTKGRRRRRLRILACRGRKRAGAEA